MFTDGSYPQLGAGQTIGPGIKKVKHEERSRQQKAPQNDKNMVKKWQLRKVFLEPCKKTANFSELCHGSTWFRNGAFSRKPLISIKRIGTFGIFKHPKNAVDSETTCYNLATF